MEIINLIANIFTCIGILVALCEFYYFKKSILVENERAQKEATINFYREVAAELYEMNSVIYKKYERNIVTYEDIMQEENIRLVVKKYLNTMEWISTGINTGVYDLNVFDRLYGDVTIKLHEQLHDYIVKRRDVLGEREIYQDYELLINRLKVVHIKNRNQLLNKNAEMQNKF